MVMLKFLKVKNILWDYDSIGDDLYFSLLYYRYVFLYVVLIEYLLVFFW